MNEQRSFLGLAAAALLSTACTGGEARETADAVDAEVAGAEHRSAHDVAPLGGEGPWTMASTGGASVTLGVEPAPLAAGSVSLTVTVADGTRPTSVDLVSPTMPMHGIVRVPFVEGGTTIRIPMEGLWALYVNLDDGGDTAEFLFEVGVGEGGPVHDHGAASSSEPAMDHAGHGNHP